MKGSDFIIVGSGIAGLFLAEKLSLKGSVTLITKAGLSDGNTILAQGGMAAVRDFKNDSIEAHIRDTLLAGNYQNNPEAVSFLVENANLAMLELEKMGIVFDKEPTREGGHSFPRIWHKDDFSGEYIEEALILRVQKNPKINIWDNAYVYDLIVEENICQGVKVIDHNEQLQELFAEYVVLATGGFAGLFEKTTNPLVTVGNGVALAVLNQVVLKDLEFVQFHPTVLDVQRRPMFLLSEALRGEGATLVNTVGENFMSKYHQMGDLAPRDIVCRAIYQEQKKGKVYLDMRHKNIEFLRGRFPNIVHELRKYDLKLERDLIPVTPAAHYTCGGIQTDLNGRTSLLNLFAIGEVACTGVHGANRLASNSLLEGIVFALSVFNYLNASNLENQKNVDFKEKDAFDKELLENTKNLYLKNVSERYLPFLKEVQIILWQYFGLVRNRVKMQEGLNRLKQLEFQDYRSRNVYLTALAFAKSCLARQESLGGHWVEESVF